MLKPTQAQVAEYADEMDRLAVYQRAEAALHENAAKEARAGITHETPEFLRLNQDVIDAEKQLPKRFRKG